MIRPLCKQVKRSAMPEPVKRLTPNVGSVVALRGGQSLLYFRSLVRVDSEMQEGDGE